MKVLVVGCHGKMGQIAIAAIEQDNALSYVGGCDSTDSLLEVITTLKPDIAIDFTNPKVVYSNVEVLLAARVKTIIGTSGLSSEQIVSIQHNCAQHKVGCLLVPNFSIGAMLLMEFSAKAAKYFGNAHITETHHLEKQDAPSATAIATAKLIQNSKVKPKLKHKSVELLAGSLGANYQDVTINSLRMPGKIAQQSVTFADYGELLSINHDTVSREVFIPGIQLACQQISKLDDFQMGLDLA